MARCYEIICEQCQEAYWAAQKGAGDDTIRWYDPAKVCAFLERHKGHRVIFDEDQHLPDPDAADWIRPFGDCEDA